MLRLFICLSVTLTPLIAFAQNKPIGSLGSIIGTAQIVRDGKFIPATKGLEIYASDSLKTDARTAVKILFTDGGTFMAFENASVKIEEYKVQQEGNNVNLKSAFTIAKGKVRFFVKPQPGGKVDAKYKTSNAVMGIRGTSGFIDATDPSNTQLVVLTGKVEVSNPLFPAKAVFVSPNQMTTVALGAAPDLPKDAPPALLGSLNSEAKRMDADPAGNRGAESKEKSAPADGEKKEEKKEDKKEDKKEGKKPSDGEKKEEKKPVENRTEAKPEASKPGATASTEQTAPAPKMEKMTVFTPDGNSEIVVKDENFNRLVAPANVDTGLSTKSPVTAPPIVQTSVIENTSAILATDFKSRVTAIEKVTTATETVQTAVQNTVVLPKKQTIKIQIVLPKAP